MFQEGTILLEIAHSVQKETEHPNTPAWVKEFAKTMIYTNEVGLTMQEIELLNKIKKILAGEGLIANIAEDAIHIFEAQKYGSYFITTDRRLLNKKFEIKRLCSLVICKPSELLSHVKLHISNQET